jgi:rSAM/selenodomain-associated transferase 1
MNNNALIIMAKHPDPDMVKTRLKGHLSDETRLALYISLLKTTIQKLRALAGIDTFISFSPESEEAYFARFGLRAFAQIEGDLGERMFHALNRVFDEGYRKVAVVGVDTPDISEAIVLKAFTLLSDAEIVFGPARDGGYYLVAMKKPIREIFQDIPWSTDKTLKQSLQKAKELDCRVDFTDTLSDIDTIDDLRRSGLSVGGASADR